MSHFKIQLLGSALVLAALAACSDEGSVTTPTTSTAETQPGAPTASRQAAQAIGDVVQTRHGAVRGEMTVDDLVGVSARIFRAIPYAAPPVGDLR